MIGLRRVSVEKSRLPLVAGRALAMQAAIGLRNGAQSGLAAARAGFRSKQEYRRAEKPRHNPRLRVESRGIWNSLRGNRLDFAAVADTLRVVPFELIVRREMRTAKLCAFAFVE